LEYSHAWLTFLVRPAVIEAASPLFLNVLAVSGEPWRSNPSAPDPVFRPENLFSCNFLAACVTHRSMRNWMRERMKRRKKKPENETEATGKVGQQKPLVDEFHPEPIVPAYDQGEAEASTAQNAATEMPAAEEPRMETEVQPESPSTPPPGGPEQRTVQQAGKSASRPPKGVVVLAIGLPGSGKTTWFKRRGVTPLSSDMLRSILFDDITEQRYQGLVFSTLRSLLRARLIARMPWNYVDASNLAPHERRQWIKMAKGFGYEVHAVFFDVPIEVCLERNRKRERQVKEDVIQRMAAKLKAPGFEEGFGKITVVRVKRSEEPSQQ
jgi:predicted kinase